MKETESIDEFAGKISCLTSKFSGLGAILEDNALVKKLLDSVPNKYLQVVAAIEQFSDMDTMPFKEAIGRLKAYEERIQRHGDNNSDGQALLIHGGWQTQQKN